MYWCPPGSSNAPYKLYATIQAHNGTTSSVTIESVGAVLTLAAVKGSWLEHVGDQYDASNVTFTPNAVGAGSDVAVSVTVPSSCTNGKQPADFSSLADYSVALTVTTTSGTYKVTTQNRHRLISG